jgi:adenine-specific DNA-methyltransferase
MVDDRLLASFPFLRSDGVLCVTIDDYQLKELLFLIERLYTKERLLGLVGIRINPSGRITKDGLAVTHEYAIFAGASPASALGRLPRSERQIRRFKGSDDDGAFEWRNFRREGSSSERHARPRRYFPLYCRGKVVRVPKLEWDDTNRQYAILEEPAGDEVICYPRDKDGGERVWRWGLERVQQNLEELEARVDKSGICQVYYKYRPEEDGVLAPSLWVDAKYSATEHGTALLKNLFGERNTFSFPKSVFATSDCISISGMESEEAVCIDYFAGSGTTGHAAIDMNRGDSGNRKYVLVEMGSYFDEVLRARLQKAVYSKDWRDGKPIARETGISHCIKYIRLESYEDALNNLELHRTAEQEGLLADNPEVREDYTLGYMLDVETQGSPSLLNIDAFTDPTAYKLKVKRGDETRPVNVDLVETFDYLLGLTIRHLAAPQSFAAAFKRDEEGRLVLDGRLRPAAGPYWFRTVEGTDPDGHRVLVVWRKLTGSPEQDNLVLDEWFRTMAYSTRDLEFDLIYVNGDNNLENLRREDETWKVRLTEEYFKRLMFDVKDV